MLRRPRRNRKSAVIRDMVRETWIAPQHLIYPLFIENGVNIKTEIKTLPNNYRFSIDTLLKEIEECVALGIKSFVLFPAVEESLKDKYGTYGYSASNFYLQAASKIKTEFPDIVLMSDVALDPYSSDGHDGIVENGEILNDETLEVLQKLAVSQAQAGFDIIGPSDMMDGRVKAIRQSLDGQGYINTSIMSYTAKYASAFYGPFRDALDSAPKAGDKKTYQMDPANKQEALIEAQLDEEEGADMLMVKPALCYLDIIHILANQSPLPITAYNVSGECAMLTAAVKAGMLDYDKAMPEMLLSIRRAGATAILTYFAKDFARLYKDGKIKF